MSSASSAFRSKPDDFPIRRTRRLRFVEVWQAGDWVLKIYLHSAHSDELPSEFLIGAKTLIEPQLLQTERMEPTHRVGFLILAHGAVSNWVMFDWWSSFHLYQRIFRADGMPPDRFIEAPPNLFQCVYDLRITAFESEAWRKCVVENPHRDVDAYLEHQLNIDV